MRSAGKDLQHVADAVRGGVGEVEALAVLPFQDLSTARDNQVFCDGLTEELLNALAHLPDLRVTARNSAFALRDSTRDVRTVGNRLGVKYLLDGSVRRDGARVRVTAQLVSVEDGFQVWSNSFDRPYADVLTIQESIARDVARVLEVKLSPEADRRLGAPPTPKISAYELYLLGRFQQQQRTPEALERAIEYQQQAIAIDPGFALAYAGLADAHMARVYYANRLLAEEEPDILRAVDRALALNPQLAEAYAARAVLRTEQWNSDAAIEDLNRAIAILPNYADAYVRLGAAYEYRAEPALALKNYEAAAQLDPLHVQLHVRRCLTLQNMGRYQPAAQACERALTLKPGNANTLWARALIDLGRGRVDVAIRGYREAVAAAPHRADLLAQLGWLYLDLGMIEEGRAALDHAVEDGRDVPAIRLERARLFLATGDRRALQMYLDSLGLAAVANAAELLDAALLEQVAGRDDVAQALAARALRDPDFHEERLLNNVWATRWGRSDILTLAELALRSGDRAGHERYTKMLSAWIERVIRNGQVWHGAEYLRGALLALRGDPDGAMAALQRAYALGWRRGWWLRNDPAFAQLRGRADFARLLQRMESDDSVMRAKLSPR